MTVLALTRYGTLGASSRVRFLQFVPALAAAGIRVTVAPLLDDDYVRRVNAGRAPQWASVVVAYIRRLRDLVATHRPDVLWVEKELFPYLPGGLERLFLAGRRVVVDYDDATFHTYDLHPRPAVRRLLGRKIDGLMARADLVVAGNPYLAGRAEAAGAPRVEVVPSVIDTDRYGPRTPELAGPFTIGWIGSPGSERLLLPFSDVLAAATAEPDTRLVLVGASARALPGVPHETWPWSDATEVDAMRAFHVGIMPLTDSPWERGKCGFKLVQCMGAGRPVVASPVGVNPEIVGLTVGGADGAENGHEAGFLPADPAGWAAALGRLRADPALRARLGAAARARAESLYSISATAPRLADLLRSVASR